MSTILLTGAAGYLGQHIATSLRRSDHTVLEASRRNGFELASPTWPVSQPVDTLIHAAWDMTATRWTEIEKVNVQGSLRLFDRAHAHQVRQIIFISSMSAYADAKSRYGRAKFFVEERLHKLVGCSVRPGLVYSIAPGGMLGSLRQLVKKLPVLPVIDGGAQVLYPCHVEDLSGLICWAVEHADQASGRVFTAANREGFSFRTILELTATRDGRRPLFFSLPFIFVYGPLRLAEYAGLRLRLKSDSLVSLLNQNPDPDFSSTEIFHQAFRPGFLNILPEKIANTGT